MGVDVTATLGRVSTSFKFHLDHLNLQENVLTLTALSHQPNRHNQREDYRFHYEQELCSHGTIAAQGRSSLVLDWYMRHPCALPHVSGV